MIRRFLNDENFGRLQKDFKFLIKTLKSFQGELELSFRDNYFNLYSRGNSAAKVEFKNDDKYKISINKKFYPKSLDDDFSSVISGDYHVIEISSKFVHPLFKKQNLDKIYSKIKKVNHSEELSLEQMLINDNSERKDLIIIDRQVTDKPLQRKRMDLLALKQKEGNQFYFCVLEVKMGNNPELKNDVAKQLEFYVNHVTEYFEDYKQCYEIQYRQKKAFGLFSKPEYASIEIVREVQGIVVVAGYSGIAKDQLKALKDEYQDLEVETFSYQLGKI